MDSSAVSLKCTCLGNPVGILYMIFFFIIGKMLHIVEAREHPLGSESVLTVLNNPLMV